MDFEQRLEKAIERGHRASSARARADSERALTEEEFKRLHSQYRLKLSEHIEQCLKRLPQHFPGFQYETVVSERGWGGKVSRDDLVPQAGRRANLYSRLEMVVRPYSSYHVLELTAKGTVHNKEIYNRTHYQRLEQVDPHSYEELVDLWVLEYAELYAAKS
jgi:hypothetical protein